MKLKGVLKTVCLVLAVGLFFSFPGKVSAKKIVLKYANFPPAKTFPCVQMFRWAKEVEKRTLGMVKVETYPGGTLLGAKQILDGVINGIADIGCLCMPYQPGRFPLLAGVDTPVGFKSTTVASLVLWDLYRKYEPKELSMVKVVTLFTCAPGQLMTKVPVKKLSDLKGLEIRTTGATKSYIERLGGVPVAMPMSDVPEALQKGVVKGILSSLDILMDFKFAEYCRYVTILNAPTASFAVVMNKKRWESLPRYVQHVIDDMAREQAEWTGRYLDRHCKESLEWSKKHYGVKVFHLSKEDMDKVIKLTKPLIEAYIKKASAKGLPAKQFIDDLFKLKKAYEEEGI